MGNRKGTTKEKQCDCHNIILSQSTQVRTTMEECIVKDPPQSNCKGKRKPQRYKPPAEMKAKKSRTCANCKKRGHNIRTCKEEVEEVAANEQICMSKHSIDEPRVGLEFDCMEAAKKFYNDYAFKMEFSIRKSSHYKARKQDDAMTSITYCCSKAGYSKSATNEKDPPHLQCKGRRKPQRLKLQIEKKAKIPRTCKACGKKGHNIRTCKENVDEAPSNEQSFSESLEETNEEEY
ncbi:hypothetical protein ACMD2_19314 [Ananas comosus]|uniref:CCHC-type domain-containing protein n=1 Tax=Ananas comosus TaxID=4615 RepID=A0A199UP75_ANACO|nr:hypothetical protein ACMD2_19314 [Ananas comosus]